MYVKKLPELDYGVSVTMKALGGKWKPCLLDCIHLGIRRPSEMKRNIPGSTLRVLGQQLKELEELNIVYKKIYPEVPLRVEYYLTEWGTCLIPVIALMNKWGNDYSEHHCLGDCQTDTTACLKVS
ncbi:HxlR family transcriptional regulator [Chitinophaga niastensis]|uniref:HxlR family transcriptional regulator n=1 Tax=Chitinophaga niastensis TaxID=536980 RepID=A0A2P8HMA4_CHINA|nr:winged helix-turn-helix transcriptional regulator [Chitinophaga niastensis]PSL47343.1 HxlR family transcriptional regulator [Chitinophaga niastensis]